MENHKKNGWKETLPLPAAILRQYPGKHIIFSDEVGRVIGFGETEEEAFEQAKASGVKGEWHVAYAHRADESIF